MTEENWSLKTAWNNGHYSLFEHEVFETLRRKLIEDIEELFKDYSWEQNFSEEVINIINKRFGVK